METFLKDPSWIQAFCSVLGLIITALGTLYVVKSFREQAKINRQQTEINRLAMEKDRREIRPYFKIDKDWGWGHNGNIPEYKFSINLSNAPAYNVEIRPNSANGEQFQDNKHSPVMLSTIDLVYTSEFPLNKSFDVLLTPNPNPGHVVSVVIIVFNDEQGRKYRQIVEFSEQINISIPKLI
jgi:hypothetical protein